MPQIFMVSVLMLAVSLSAFSDSAKKENGWRSFVMPSTDVLKKKLTPEQFRVTQQEDTETPFKNEFWNNKRDGIYVDVVSGEPLFSSTDKYDSDCGWPTFSKPIEKTILQEKVDRKLSAPRTEIRSKVANSHLGHVFDDGPGPTGKRYCLNSAAMRFVPVEQMKAEGYEDYLHLFKGKKK